MSTQARDRAAVLEAAMLDSAALGRPPRRDNELTGLRGQGRSRVLIRRRLRKLMCSWPTALEWITDHLYLNGRCAGCGGVLGPRLAWRTLRDARAKHRHCMADGDVVSKVVH